MLTAVHELHVNGVGVPAPQALAGSCVHRAVRACDFQDATQLPHGLRVIVDASNGTAPAEDVWDLL